MFSGLEAWTVASLISLTFVKSVSKNAQSAVPAAVTLAGKAFAANAAVYYAYCACDATRGSSLAQLCIADMPRHNFPR